MNSHIVPEFLHKPLYDEKHRALTIRSDDAPKRVQNGQHERLLCSGCEQLVQKSEDYFARLWYQKCPVPQRLERDCFVLEGIDYQRFKLFLISVAWRASVSRLRDFDSAGLGRHESIMRKMLLEQSAGAEDAYPIYAGLIVDPGTRALWDQVVLVPIKIRVGPHWVLRMVFGGAAWTVMTSSHQTLPLNGYFLRESGELVFPVLSSSDFAKASGLVHAAHQAHRKALLTSTSSRQAPQI
jgi:hypothetical protein